MARAIHQLSPAKVMNAKVGRYADGGGLYLQVVPNGRRIRAMMVLPVRRARRGDTDQQGWARASGRASDGPRPYSHHKPRRGPRSGP